MSIKNKNKGFFVVCAKKQVKSVDNAWFIW
jgi:hypothetical protein